MARLQLVCERKGQGGIFAEEPVGEDNVNVNRRISYFMAIISLLCGQTAMGQPALPTVVVFDMEFKLTKLKTKLSQSVASKVTEMLRETVSGCGAYKVMPQAQLQKMLSLEKTSAHRRCATLSCRRKVARKLKAGMFLSATVVEAGDACRVTGTLHVVKTGARRTASETRTCLDIKTSIQWMVARLAGAAHSKKAPVSTWVRKVIQYQQLMAEARQLRKEGRKSLCAVKCINAWATTSGWEAQDCVARHYMERGQMKTAYRLAKQTLLANPNAPYAHLVKGTFLVGKGKKKAGYREFRVFIRLCPSCEYADVIRESLRTRRPKRR